MESEEPDEAIQWKKRDALHASQPVAFSMPLEEEKGLRG